LIFNFYDKYLENKFVKEIEFNTLLDISGKDALNEVIIKKDFGISLIETEGALEFLAVAKERDEVGSREMSVRIPLARTEDGGNYYFKASESEDKELWPVIEETFAEGLRYHLDDLVISYDTREASLTLAMELE
jgi:hypothetical protein